MNDTTLIYYSSNREKPEFEQRIRNCILENCGGLPIISVTQKPIDFGRNICVGDVGCSGFNMFRQVQIACKEATTQFVTSIEADCVYPPDYLSYIPERDDICYRDSNLYVMGQHRRYFYKKPFGATHAQVVGRQYYLDILEKWFTDEPEWDVNQRNFPKEKTRHHVEDVFWRTEILYYETENPVVQIKTSQSMRHYTVSQREPIYTIPYWGNGGSFREKFYNIGFRH